MTPFCLGMIKVNHNEPSFQLDDPDELRKEILRKTADKDLDSLLNKVIVIIANDYKTLDTLSDIEQDYLLCHWKNLKKNGDPVGATDTIFYKHLEKVVQQNQDAKNRKEKELLKLKQSVHTATTWEPHTMTVPKKIFLEQPRALTEHQDFYHTYARRATTK